MISRALRWVAWGTLLVIGSPFFILGSILVVVASCVYALADLIEPPSPEPSPEPTSPDYESVWELVEDLGSISVYRNGSRYTTQRSQLTLDLTPRCYLGVIPPSVLAELREKLPETHFSGVTVRLNDANPDSFTTE